MRFGQSSCFSLSWKAGSATFADVPSTGDVTINAPFTGTIICDGTVTIGANVTAALNVDLADAKNGATPLTDYVRAFTASRQASSDAWALNNLVVYENWKKY